MDKTDKQNAHVRQNSTGRKSPLAKAAEAQHLLDDPAFQDSCDELQKMLVTAIADLNHDGSEEDDNFEREMCQELRMLRKLKQHLGNKVQIQTLRTAGFKTNSEVN